MDKIKNISKEYYILCLGARNGGEVMAFRKLGFLNTIGVDLYPIQNVCIKEQVVFKGDFHNLDFESNSFNILFSNSIDHIYDPELFLKECDRVLKIGGFCIFYLGIGSHIGDLESNSIKDKLLIFKTINKFNKYEIIINEDNSNLNNWDRSLNFECILCKKS